MIFPRLRNMFKKKTKVVLREDGIRYKKTTFERIISRKSKLQNLDSRIKELE